MIVKAPYENIGKEENVIYELFQALVVVFDYSFAVTVTLIGL